MRGERLGEAPVTEKGRCCHCQGVGRGGAFCGDERGTLHCSLSALCLLRTRVFCASILNGRHVTPPTHGNCRLYLYQLCYVCAHMLLWYRLLYPVGSSHPAPVRLHR